MNKKRVLLLKRLNNRGSILLISYFVILVLLGSGAAFVMLAIQEQNLSERQRLREIAFHIAEAGLERAIYDIREDYDVSGGTVPSLADGDINGYTIGPCNSPSWCSIPYDSDDGTIDPNNVDPNINGGDFTVNIQNTSDNHVIWVRSTGTIDNVSRTVQARIRMNYISVWDNAIFAGEGQTSVAGGTYLINGSVNVYGSIHILGENPDDPTDFLASNENAMTLGGNAEIVANSYDGVPTNLKDRVPVPIIYDDESGTYIETLGGELRVKHGQVSLAGSASVGRLDDPTNSYTLDYNNDGVDETIYIKEKVDGTYVTDGFEIPAGEVIDDYVYSDNGVSNQYDAEGVSFPRLSDDLDGNGQSFQQDFYDDPNTLKIIDDGLANIEVGSNLGAGVCYPNACGFNDDPAIPSYIEITWDAASQKAIMDVKGKIYVEGYKTVSGQNIGLQWVRQTTGSGKGETIEYTGSGTILVAEDVDIDVDVLTPEDSDAGNINTSYADANETTYPVDTRIAGSPKKNIIGVMTPKNLYVGATKSQVNMMGIFYAENKIQTAKQTNVMGTFVSNYFDMTDQVPNIYQVPDVVNNLPPGIIDVPDDQRWRLSITIWKEIYN